jgi:hypothetical protein
MYGGVAFWPSDPRVQARVRSYERLRRSETTLAEDVIAALEATPAR